MTRKFTTKRAVFSLSALALVITGGVLYAGPLDPPTGPVTSTYKTISEVEPRIAINAANTPGDANSLFKITQPGSYYLTGNITGVSGKRGIEIASSGVTLDLNGFELLGGAGTFDAIGTTVSDLRNIAVFNGSIRSWEGDGVDLGSLPANCIRVERLRVFFNSGTGVVVGSFSIVTGCSISNCDARGISGGNDCVVTDCTVFASAGDGFYLTSDGTVARCAATVNRRGFVIGAGTITDCVSTGNFEAGFQVGSSSLVRCVSITNFGNGFLVGTGSAVTSCTSLANALNGFSAENGTVISNCVSNGNRQHGITTDGGCSIIDSVCRNNDIDGILVPTGCTVRGNTCTSNGDAGNGAGIHATGSNNRIEGNACNSANRGIDIDGAGNIVIRNTCSGNATNWDIAASNAVAQIVFATTNAAPIVGNTYGGVLGSSDPNANFTY